MPKLSTERKKEEVLEEEEDDAGTMSISAALELPGAEERKALPIPPLRRRVERPGVCTGGLPSVPNVLDAEDSVVGNGAQGDRGRNGMEVSEDEGAD